MVEKQPDFIQGILQAVGAVNVELPDHGFEATKETFDPTIAPRGLNRDGLFTNSGQFEKRSKQAAVENGLVVGSDGVGFAISANGKAQMPDQSPTALVQNGRKLRANAGPVVDSA